MPTFHEVWIIDHSTTTPQAAGHVGGDGGRGGDLLYRWGNPATYNSGDSTDQHLFYPHDIHWVNDFLDDTHPYFDKIAVFNNRVGIDFSTANVFSPPWDMYSWEYTFTGTHWGPNDVDLTITHPVPQALHSTGLSSVQFLPNGNTLICSGRWGYSFEITPANQIVWEYKTPIRAGNAVLQGDTLDINNNLTFRLKRYPTDYAAFAGKDLTPQGYIELNPNVTFCDSILSNTIELPDYNLVFFPNPTSGKVTIEWEGGPLETIEIYDITGRRVDEMEAIGGRKYLNISDWLPGMYFVRIGQGKMKKLVLVGL